MSPDTPAEDRYTVRYRNADGGKVDICVAAEHVTEAVEAACQEVSALKAHPHRIYSVIRGCK